MSFNERVASNYLNLPTFEKRVCENDSGPNIEQDLVELDSCSPSKFKTHLSELKIGAACVLA